MLRTPEQLDVLAEAGVVDAGAHGLVLILAGIVAGLRGEETPQVDIPAQAPARFSAPQHTDSRFRYCVNFIVQGSDLDGPSFEPRLRELGDSILVVGDRADPAGPRPHRRAAAGPGGVRAATGPSRRSTRPTCASRWRSASGGSPPAGTSCGVVAVVSGDGLRQLYEELGATVVDGGPTMNPSTDELLAGNPLGRR